MGGLLVGGTASASTPEDGDKITVCIRVADLNLYSDAGVATMLKRVGRAADRARRRALSMLELVPVYQKCRASVMESAAAQANSSLLSVRFAEVRGRSCELASR